MSTIRSRHGFTLIETVVTMAVVALLAAGMVTVSNYLLNKQQLDTTIDNLNQIRRAIAGNPVIVVNEARTSFGYLGDMGGLPTKLDDLWIKGSQPAFTFDSAKKAGAGWNGPYLDIGTAELAAGLGLDGWGNPFAYTTSSFIDSAFSATALGKILSLGPDLASGTSDDVTIDFFKATVVSRVQGFVKDSAGDPAPGVGVTVNFASSGLLTSTTVLTDDTGYYFAPDIPYGNRSITIDPKLVLAQGTAVVSGNNNQNVTFTVKNFASTDVTIASIGIEFTITPTAYFTQIKVGTATVYNYSSLDAVRFGTGDSKSFTGQVVAGTGAAKESVAIRLQSPVTDVADLSIGDIGKGGSKSIELNGFNSAETGTGTDVDVTGVSLEVTFRNASNEIVGLVVVQP